MASGNRVEELESRVQELEATVDGLTDELVECKVRVRELENAVDAEIGLEGPDGSGDEQPEEADLAEVGPEGDGAKATKSEAPESEDETESEDGDIIVA
jgi:hypothetical protein